MESTFLTKLSYKRKWTRESFINHLRTHTPSNGEPEELKIYEETKLKMHGLRTKYFQSMEWKIHGHIDVQRC